MIGSFQILAIGILLVSMWSFNQMRKNFNESLFFKIASLLMLVVGISNTFDILTTTNGLSFFILIAKLSGNLFNYLLAYFFFYLMRKNQKSSSKGMLTPEELNKYLTENETPNKPTN